MKENARKKPEQITVRLEEDTFAQVKALAEADRRSLGWMARELLKDGLKAKLTQSVQKSWDTEILKRTLSKGAKKQNQVKEA